MKTLINNTRKHKYFNEKKSADLIKFPFYFFYYVTLTNIYHINYFNFKLLLRSEKNVL